MTSAALELTGRAHWWLTVGEDDKPVIWPIPAPWIQSKHEPGKPFASWIIHPGGDTEKVEVPAEEIVYFYYPDPSNPMGWVSPTQANARAVVSAEAVQDARCAAFRNGHWPGLVVVAGDITDDEGTNQGKPLLEREQRNQINAAINRMLQGVDKSGAPIILDRLISNVYKLTNTPREMDFLTSSKIARDEVFQGHGVSQYITGSSEPGSRAASATAMRHFADFVVNPKADMISQILTKAVAPRMAKANERLYIYLEPYRPADEENSRANYQVLVQAGAVTKNELRSNLEGLPPRDDCEELVEAGKGGGGGFGAAGSSDGAGAQSTDGGGEPPKPAKPPEPTDEGDAQVQGE
jgi:phage portal protein BeeE